MVHVTTGCPLTNDRAVDLEKPRLEKLGKSGNLQSGLGDSPKNLTTTVTMKGSSSEIFFSPIIKDTSLFCWALVEQHNKKQKNIRIFI
jgi:hypothetical protein